MLYLIEKPIPLIHKEKELKPLLRLLAFPGVGVKTLRKILDHYGSAAAFFAALRAAAGLFLPENSPPTPTQINPKTGGRTPPNYWHEAYIAIAEREYQFIKDKKIQLTYYKEDSYPFYLKQAVDAPVLLFGKGNLELENRKIIAVVGTRSMTAHAADFCNALIEELAPLDPVIVSGFAKGVDICAQRAAVAKGLKTIGCLAHGFKSLYPVAHTKDINPVLEKGGFYTEFLSTAPALRGHFVSRNRVIAGLSQATVVVESAKKGGSLHTAQLAESYNRSVFAVPGRPSDYYSVGCNDLIKHLKAQMITSARDLVMAMNWEKHPNLSLKLGGPIVSNEAGTSQGDNSNSHEKSIDTGPLSLHQVPLSIEEKAAYTLLHQKGKLHLDTMARALSWEIKILLPCLMVLELKGMVRSLAGKFYEAI